MQTQTTGSSISRVAVTAPLEASAPHLWRAGVLLLVMGVSSACGGRQIDLEVANIGTLEPEFANQRFAHGLAPIITQDLECGPGEILAKVSIRMRGRRVEFEWSCGTPPQE